MGIRGLTTYVEQRSDQLFETFKLKDCSLVIDGNSLVAQLYQRVYKSNSAFGGDYDAYADSVRHFFNVLRRCNVIPFILLDGGYEVKKLKTVKSRFQTRICDARKVSPLVQMKRSVFPLMLIAVFKEVVFEMGIKLVQCGFEADHEIAAVARAMKCPVLSYDSDFYIYDVLYIPFDTFSLEAVEMEKSPGGTKFYAIDCKVYKVENFLMSFGGLDKTVLPLMATVLGNDYIQKNVFQNFFSKIKHPKSRTSSDTQRHIVGLLTWLRGKTPAEAVAMILACIKQRDRQRVLEQLNKSVGGYNRTSDVLPLLCPDLAGHEPPARGLSPIVGDAAAVLADEECSRDDSDVCLANVPYKPTAQEEVFQALPHWFKQNFYKGLLPSSVLDMISLRMYFCQPQVEDYSLPHSHELSLAIIPVIFGLLTSHETKTSGLTFTFRSKNAEMRRVVLDPVKSMTCLTLFPSLQDVPDVPGVIRASVILELVGLEAQKTLLETVPDAWKLFVVAIVFWARHTSHLRSSLSSMISALLLTAISLKVVDGVVGYFRTRKHFLRSHGSKVKKIERSEKSKHTSDDQCNTASNSSINDPMCQDDICDENIQQSYCDENLAIPDALKNVLDSDCFLFVETFILFRYFDESLKRNPKLYDVTVVHALAQFQSCLSHLTCLNAVLDFPFEQTKVSSFFSGTAVYNLFANFRKRTNLSLYITQLFGRSPSILRLFFSFQKIVTAFLPDVVAHSGSSRNRKRKNARRKNLEDVLKCAEDELTNENLVLEEEDVFVDKSNKFSVLCSV